MSQAASRSVLTVALIGNPNTGKSTLFNALAGVSARVGNFPGVTVEKKVARVRWDGRDGGGALLMPGLYLLEVSPAAERAGTRLLRTLAIVY